MNGYHSSYGRKIEKALRFQTEHPYTDINIINEDHWAKYVLAEPIIKIRPEKKRRTSLPGQLIKISDVKGLEPPETLEPHCAQILSAFLKKGWCVFQRSGYVGLTGYTTEIKDFIPLQERTINAPYLDFTTKDGQQKTREYLPRQDRIIDIAYFKQVDNQGAHIANKWEVKTYWSVKRNLFDDFASAWALFLEIERRYDPGKIVWTKLDEYDQFEDY